VTVVGAVLAAGASTRLGHRKQLILVDGEPLVRRTARIARASRCSEIAVVLGAFADEIAPALDGLDVALLDNPRWPEGMGSSVRVASAWALERCADLLLMVCDQPRLTTAHLDALIAIGGLVGSAYADTIGVPALFPVSNLAALAMVRGDRGAHALLANARSIAWPGGAIDLDLVSDLVQESDDGDR
jgi:molybdenum cofactor cytidylyltransferase